MKLVLWAEPAHTRMVQGASDALPQTDGMKCDRARTGWRPPSIQLIYRAAAIRVPHAATSTLSGPRASLHSERKTVRSNCAMDLFSMIMV